MGTQRSYILLIYTNFFKVGMETAKNLVLAGPRSVTLCDDNILTI